MGVKAPPPVEAEVQFASPFGKLVIDRITDPSGAPTDVLDADTGFTVEGQLKLPGWLSGQAVLTLSADEIGGPIDTQIAQHSFPVGGSSMPSPGTPGLAIYPWSFTVNPIAVDEDKMYQLGLVFVLRTPAGGHTEIAAFFDLGAYLVV